MKSDAEPFNTEISESITVLRCLPGFYASKIHSCTPDGTHTTKSHRAGKFFTVREITVMSIFDLHEALLELADRRDELVIRGAINPDVEISEKTRVRRAARIDPELGEKEPWFVEAPRRWVLLDFDGIPNSGNIDPTSSTAMEHLRSLLPTEFHDVTCSFSLSSSAGLSGNNAIRGHLWFYLDRPVGVKELKSWLVHAPVDKSLFLTVQQHFVAAPQFENGRVDPIRQRKGILLGRSDEVRVPAIELSDRSHQKVRGASGGLKAADGYEARIAKLGDGPEGEGCHGVITPAIAAYLGQHGPGADRKALKEDIRTKAATAQWDRSKHPEAYVEREISDEVLDRSIQDWIQKAFITEGSYPEASKLPLDDARRQVTKTFDEWVLDAFRWHDQWKYLQARIEGRVRLVPDAAGGIGWKYDPAGKPWPMYKGQTIQSLRPPPRHAIAAQVSIGKTKGMIDGLPTLVDRLKRGHCVLITVPDHRLSAEMKERILNAGLDAEIYLGPAQPDPDNVDVLMCRRHEDFSVFRAAGLGKKLCTACSFRGSCGYLRQRTKKSAIWIAAHNLLYHRRRAPIPPVDFVIVDEDPVSAGYDGSEDEGAIFLDPEDVPSDVAAAIRALPLGQSFKREEFRLFDERLQALALACYREVRDVEISEAATNAEIEAVRKVLTRNLLEIGKARLYEQIRIHGPFGMRVKFGPNDRPLLHWNYQRRLHRDFDMPMVFLDATLQRDVVRHLIDVEQPPVGYRPETFEDEDGSISVDYPYPLEPIVGPVTEIAVETPAVKVRQVLFSAAASKFKDDDQGRANVRKIHRYIEARAAFAKSVLVICQKSLEGKLLELGLPPNVQLAHFNAVRGKDVWRNVDVLVVIGRTQAPPKAAETHAEALFRTPIGTLADDEYYGHVWKPLGGQARLVRVERHFDPLAELVRWGICEAELIQAIGRGRPANRTAASPLEVDLINAIPLPNITVHEVIEWNDAQPSPVAVVAGRYGLLLPQMMVPGMAGVLAALLPDLFSSENAARQAGVYSRAVLPNESSHTEDAACEYIAAQVLFDMVSVKLKGGRYSVPALLLNQEPRELKNILSTVLPSGLSVSAQLPRKWREKLRSPEEIAQLFGLGR